MGCPPLLPNVTSLLNSNPVVPPSWQAYEWVEVSNALINNITGPGNEQQASERVNGSHDTAFLMNRHPNEPPPLKIGEEHGLLIT